MPRRLALVVLVVLLATGGSAAGSSINDRQETIRSKIERLRDKIAEANRREQVLTSEISAVTSKIRALEGDVTEATARLHTLEGELSVHKNRLANLTQIYQLQTKQFELMKRQYAAAERRLQERLVAMYQEEEPTTIDVFLSARSFADLLDQLDYVSSVGQQDRSIAGQVARAREDVRRARRKTNLLRTDVAQTAKAVEARLDEQLAERSRLISAQTELAGARQAKQRTLASVQATEEEFLHEVEGLEQASRELTARIQAAQGTAVSYGTPSAMGMVWPVAGPVTSTFGWRWGRMHEGIDIGVASGTPIVAAASGTVIFSGWMGGYGNLVVVDHGGGIATAYGHSSSNAVGVGQGVGQGQVIAYAGSTGHSTGPHLHFEVRVNGAPVDPLGYL